MVSAPLKRLMFFVLFSGIAATAFAEDAPVYDVDSYPPQFDGQSDTRPAARMQSSNESTQPFAGSSVPAPTAAAAPMDNQAPAPQPTRQLSMDQRLQRLEQQNNYANSADSAAKMNELQTEVQSLRGQVEDLNHQLQQAQTQQKTMYADLDQRVTPHSNTVLADNDTAAADAVSGAAAEATPAPAAKPKKAKKAAALATSDAAKATQSANSAATDATASADAADPVATATKADNQPNVAEEQQIYQTAYGLIKAKKYSEAATTLQKMLQKYPTGQFAANAHYWLGELYGLMGKNDQAVAEFNNVVKNYPDSPKLADAQLKLGLLFAAQFKWAEAKSSFKKVINRYPGTSSAHLAAEQLKQIKTAGH